MWVKMAKEKTKTPKSEAKKKVEIPQTHKKEKHSYFPKFLIVFSLIVIALALNNFFKWYVLPDSVVSVILLISGLWMFKIGLGKGMYKKRHEIIKKYI